MKEEVVGHGLILGGFWRCVFFWRVRLCFFFVARAGFLVV